MFIKHHDLESKPYAWARYYAAQAAQRARRSGLSNDEIRAVVAQVIEKAMKLW
jgi:hypothetical protein